MMSAASYLEKPVTPGASLCYWQLGPLCTARFDVPDAPLHGEMDPFFFLTRHQNFIPHEYPCRTIFAARHRGQRPQVQGAFAPARWWLPFGSPRVDLSGFHFRPTRLCAWARTMIWAEAAGIAELRLGTCGGAVLWVNGRERGWMAPYVRNLEEKAHFSVPLVAGINQIELFFDDLAERDCRFFFQLDYLSGPAARLLLPTPVDGAIAGGIELALEGMRFSRTAYGDGEVALVFAEPLAVEAEVTVAIEGDFMSTERFTHSGKIAAGQDGLTIGPVAGMPADFRHFCITLNAGGFVAARVLGVEICHVARQGPAPADLASRIRETLEEASNHAEPDAVCALARLASGRAGLETDAMIEGILPSVEDCHDCADFALVPLVWSRCVWGADIGAALRARLDRAILGFRYWMDEPGNDVQWYFSENHALLFHTAAYLAGGLLPEARFARSGRLGREQQRIGAERVRAWLDHFEKWEMAEFNSAPYFPIDLKGLTALAALAPDPDIASRARAGIVRLCEIVARSAHHGQLTGAQGRSYEHTLCAGRSLELSGLARLLWGRGWYGRRMHALPQMAICLRDHALVIPQNLREVACHTDESHREWRFAQGEGRFAALYHYKGRDFALGSAVHYRWQEWGYQETLLHLRLGDTPEAAIWINHPGEVILSGYGRPSFWGGCGTVPRVHQYRGLAVLLFATAAEQPDFTHAWFPAAMFDDSAIDGSLALARSGRGGVLLRGDRDFTIPATGPMAQAEIRQYGRHSRWIVRVCTASSLAEIEAGFAGLAIVEEAHGVLTVLDGEYGRVEFYPDGAVKAEGRVLSPQDFTIAGDIAMFPAGRPITN